MMKARLVIIALLSLALALPAFGAGSNRFAIRHPGGRSRRRPLMRAEEIDSEFPAVSEGTQLVVQ